MPEYFFKRSIHITRLLRIPNWPEKNHPVKKIPETRYPGHDRAAPKKVHFVVNGLLSQNFIAENGDVIIKYFFPEQRLAGAVKFMGTLATRFASFHLSRLPSCWVALPFSFLNLKR